MFEIGWSELLVIGVVLIVVVGPKDLPRMLRTFGKTTTQLKRMAGDFRKQFDEALREAELDEVRDNLKSIDPTNDIRKAMNPIRAVGDEIRKSRLPMRRRRPSSRVSLATATCSRSHPPRCQKRLRRLTMWRCPLHPSRDPRRQPTPFRRRSLPNSLLPRRQT
jgi:sec-independent protein translocase protein TatB